MEAASAPHVDSYDVFLLQASGRRRWRISRQRNLRAKQGSPINNVEGFRASSEWVLDAGDMLYLPPGVAHEGIAIGECMTYSIGFRAPSYQQLLEPWFADYAEHASPRGRYADSGATATARPAALPRQMTRQIHNELARRNPGLSDTERFLLRHLSEPKATTVFDAALKTLSLTQFRRQASFARVGVGSQDSSHLLECSDRHQRRMDRAAAGCNGDTENACRSARAFGASSEARSRVRLGTAARLVRRRLDRDRRLSFCDGPRTTVNRTPEPAGAATHADHFAR